MAAMSWGSDVGAIRIGFAKVPVKNGQEGGSGKRRLQESAFKVLEIECWRYYPRGCVASSASTIPVDQQVLGGMVENLSSNLLL